MLQCRRSGSPRQAPTKRVMEPGALMFRHGDGVDCLVRVCCDNGRGGRVWESVEDSVEYILQEELG